MQLYATMLSYIYMCAVDLEIKEMKFHFQLQVHFKKSLLFTEVTIYCNFFRKQLKNQRNE